VSVYMLIQGMLVTYAHIPPRALGRLKDLVARPFTHAPENVVQEARLSARGVLKNVRNTD